MGRYNLEKLEKHRYGILGLYINNLQDLQKGNTPSGFETYAGMLMEALPFFPHEERVEYEQVLVAGLAQLRFLRASHTVDALNGEEPSRKKFINDFLSKVD